MSDLLAPILVVMENEVDAFWCFSAFIHMMVSLSVYMSVCLSVSLSVSLCIFTWWSVCLSTCLSVCLSVCLYLCVSCPWFLLTVNKKHLKNVGPIRHNEPPHAHSPDVASSTVARRLRIDIHDNDDNDNAWQGTAMGPWNGPNKNYAYGNLLMFSHIEQRLDSLVAKALIGLVTKWFASLSPGRCAVE